MYICNAYKCVCVCVNSAPPACCKNVLLLDPAFSKKKLIEDNNHTHL